MKHRVGRVKGRQRSLPQQEGEEVTVSLRVGPIPTLTSTPTPLYPQSDGTGEELLNTQSPASSFEHPVVAGELKGLMPKSNY